jgi:hypothetical protein
VFIYSINPIALYNLICNHQVVTEVDKHLSADKAMADQPEPGCHVRSADEEPSASDLTVVHTDKEKSRDHIPGFLISV